MAFTRKFLAALGVESEKVDEIISAHNEVLEHFKNENSELKDKAKRYDEMKIELDNIKVQLKETNEKLQAAATERDDYKTKHDTIKSEKEKLEADIAGKETAAKKDKALSDMLKAENYSDEAVKLIINKGGYRDKIELDKEGKAKNIDNVFNDIKSDFAMFTPQKSKNESSPQKPPANSGNGKPAKTKEEILSIKDTAERQKAIAENMELFGKN